MIGFKLEEKKQLLRDTKNWNSNPKRYDEHPYHFTIKEHPRAVIVIFDADSSLPGSKRAHEPLNLILGDS